MWLDFTALCTDKRFSHLHCCHPKACYIKISAPLSERQTATSVCWSIASLLAASQICAFSCSCRVFSPEVNNTFAWSLLVSTGKSAPQEMWALDPMWLLSLLLPSQLSRAITLCTGTGAEQTILSPAYQLLVTDFDTCFWQGHQCLVAASIVWGQGLQDCSYCSSRGK